MPSKRHASLLVLLAVLLFLGAISRPAHAQSVIFGGAQTTVPAIGINGAQSVAVDGAGDVFIADSGNRRVVEVPAGGGPQTVVPANLVSYPLGVAVDGAGDVFIADGTGNRVVEVPAGGGSQITVGSGLNSPFSVAVDGAGDVFIADTGNNRVVKVPAGGGAQTTVGSGLNSPYGVAVDGAGDVFIADSGNNRVVEVPAGGGTQITMYIGPYNPRDVAVDGVGDVFIIEGNQVIKVRRGPVDFGSVNVCPGGQTAPQPCSVTVPLSYSVVATTTISTTKVVTQGAPALDFTINSDNNCLGTFSTGSTCTVNVTFTPLAPGVRMGAVQLTDSSGNVLVTTMIHGVGEGPAVAFGPGTQTAVPAIELNAPYGLAVDGEGDVFIADAYNNRVVEVRTDGGAQITVGTGLSDPTGVAVDGAGDVFIADEGNSRVVEVPVGCTTDICQVTVGSGLSNVFGVTVDGMGDIFIADSGNSRVLEVPAGANGVYGTQTTVGSGLFAPRNVAVDGAGNVFIADSGNNRVVEVPANGGAQTTLGIGLSTPTSVAVDAAGDVYIADSGNNRLVRVGGGRTFIMLVGLSYPSGVAVDAAGDVYFTQQGTGNHAVKLLRSQAPTLSFASTPVGTTSSDSPYLVALQNIGNQPLNAVTPGLSIGANFVQVAGPGNPADCTSSFALAPAAACVLSISFEPQSVGAFTAEATFTDNALNFAPYASQSIALQGTGLPSSQATTTALWSSVNPSISGQAVTFTATIYPQVGGKAAGTVTFKNGSATLATVAVSGNVASLTTSTLAVGTHSITAVYSGNVDFAGSTSMPVSQLVQNATVIATTTSLTSSANPSQAGKAVLFTATVSPKSGTGTPTGKVTFYNGAMALATVGVSGGTAKCNTTALPAGSDTVTAVYGGDTNYGGSTSAPLSQLVKATPIVTITPSPNPSAYGQTVYLVATVTSSVGNPPDGEKVTFKHGAAVLGTASLSSGAAIFTTSTLAVGTDAVTVVYGGDSNFAAGTSPAAAQAVNKATSTTTLVSSLNPSTAGQAVTFTATVAPQFTGTPTGTVTFVDGTTILATERVSAGAAKFTTSKLASGAHGITATYNGSTSFTISSAALTQMVN